MKVTNFSPYLGTDFQNEVVLAFQPAPEDCFLT